MYRISKYIPNAMLAKRFCEVGSELQKTIIMARRVELASTDFFPFSFFFFIAQKPLGDMGR